MSKSSHILLLKIILWMFHILLVQVGAPHRVTKDDAIKWFQTKFEGVVLNKAHAY